MSTSKTAALRAALAARGLAPRKMFGQNFMVDTNFARAIARDAAADEKTLLLEVGPGTGCLTRALLDAHPASRVLAIEIDRGLAGLLRETFAAEIDAGRLTLLEGDALAGKHHLSPDFVKAALEISRSENRPRRVLCSNLPYNIATPLLLNLALDEQRFVETALATIQLELAEKLTAEAGSDDYGGISALLALRAASKIARRVGNEIFWPRPNVASALLRLDFKPWAAPTEPGLQLSEAGLFRNFVQTVFSQRRKTLRAILKMHEVQTNARAEALPPEALLAIFRLAVFPDSR